MFGFSSLAETPFATLPTVAGQTFEVFISEAGAVSLAITTGISMNRSLSETAGGSDAIPLVQGDYSASVSQQAAAVEALLAGLSYIVSVGENATAVESIITRLIVNRNVSEAATAREDLDIQSNFTLTVDELISAATELSVQGDYSAITSETIESADEPSANVIFPATLAEFLTAQESIDKELTVNRDIIEAASVEGQYAAKANFAVNVDDLASALETLSVQGDFNVALVETGIAVDSASARLLWELINDSQPGVWQDVSAESTGQWQLVSSDAGNTWRIIKTIK